MRWSCRLKDTLYTEDFASEAFFVPEAESGWQQLTRDPALCEKLEFERKFGASFAEARLSAFDGGEVSQDPGISATAFQG